MENNKNNEAVFVNFDVKDSSVSSFISYLIAAFNRQGISPFVDGKSSHVEAGDRESDYERFPKLKVFVVVFSKNYASHMPSLERHVYSCRNNDEFVVVPVFYHVSKLSVKQYVENSGDAFKAVKRWMPKLRRCHEYDGDRSESKFQDEIARAVFEELYPTKEIGIQSSISEIENLLCKQPWGVRTIGIFGERGIGKTTLARAVFRWMSGGYDDSFFIKDFHSEYNEKRLEYLPAKYLSNTPMERFDLNCSDSEPSHRKKRVLVALDDVQKAEDAKLFLGGFDKFGLGSLIIITSKDKGILQDCQMSEIYELKGLNDHDALKLFKRCAFVKDVIEEHLLDNSKKKIKRCDGNPSAIRSYAKEFKVKETIQMEHQVSCDSAKGTCLRRISYEEDEEPHENEEFPSDHNTVLATRDTRILTGHITKDTSDRWFYHLDYYSVKSWFNHLHPKSQVLHQGFASQLQKILQMIPNTRDLDQLEILFNLSDGGIKIVRKDGKLIRKGSSSMNEFLFETSLSMSKQDLDQANGLGQLSPK